jgi:hypothetical protein
MGLTGEALDQCFGKGFSPVKSIVGFSSAQLNRPATPVTDDEADVVEQQHPAAISFNAGTGELKIESAQNGEGLWVPYLGNGKGTPKSKGWGTYSRLVTDETWVATGPFSGCYVAAFMGAGMRFAHLITPAAGYRAATVDAQLSAIQKASGARPYTKWDMTGVGLGLAFFMKVQGNWYRRFVWVGPGGNVMQINANSSAL